MRKFARTIVLTLVLTLLAPSQAMAFTGGLLQADLILSKANSPYNITQTIQIPAGVTLTVEPGVEIFSNSGSELFLVNGTVRILGTEGAPVRISSKGDVFLPKNARTARIEVRFASIDGQGRGGLIGPTGFGESAHFTFTDSDLTNFGSYSYIWYPLSFQAERNVFHNSAGFSTGFGGRTSPARVFKDNLFLGPPKSIGGEEFWIISQGASLEIQGNSFSGGPYTALMTKGSSDANQQNARANFWGTTDASIIGTMVKDKSDGLEFGALFDTSGPLSSPSQSTPNSLRFGILTSPTPTPSGNSGESANSRVKEVKVSAPSTALPGTSLRIGFTFLDSAGNPVTDEWVTLSNSGPGFFVNGGRQKPNAQGVIEALVLIGAGDLGTVSVTAATAGIIKATATVFVSTPTPPATTGPKTLKPPAPIKYKNCAALQKVYAGGVALSSKSANKGGTIKLKPTVNAKAYNLNKSLDRDKDGIACER